MVIQVWNAVRRMSEPVEASAQAAIREIEAAANKTIQGFSSSPLILSVNGVEYPLLSAEGRRNADGSVSIVATADTRTEAEREADLKEKAAKTLAAMNEQNAAGGTLETFPTAQPTAGL